MMQLDRYRKVSCQIWLDQKFLGLSDDAKLVFLLILTHPNLTSFGAMKASPASLTDELGWLTERLSTAFQEVLANGFVMYDEKVRLLVLCNFLKHNKPASPNVVKSWVHGYKELPECDLKSELFQQLKSFSEGLTEGFREAFGKAFGKAVGIQGTGNKEQGTVYKQTPKAPSDKPKVSNRVNLENWLSSLADDERAIPDNDPIFDYAEKAGIPVDYLELAWLRFRESMLAKGNLQAGSKGWRAHFRNAVQGNWYKLWYFDGEGKCILTTAGVQQRKVAA